MLIDVYKDPELYEAIYTHKNDDFPFYAYWARKSGTKVLELGCGTGRLATPLIQAGYNYTGLDTSPEFIAWCRDRFSKNSTFEIGNMRNFDLPQKYNLIFIGFNAFLHMETEKQALECLHSVRKHLAPNGRFLLDIFVPQPDFLYREKRRYRVKFINHPRNGKCIIFEKNSYDDQSEINHIQWFFEE
ncbi:MAG: class I SAM-dependent methyltransferase, partial [Candidatus Neomarinimicrobiota bacterium]